MALDIGTKSAKALVFTKNEEGVVVLGYSSRNFSEFKSDDLLLKNGKIEQAGDFKIGIIRKAVNEIIEEIKSKSIEIPENAFISLPSDILKGRVSFQNFQRKNTGEIIGKKEEKEILDIVLSDVKKEVSQSFNVSSNDVHFAALKILEIKIDGYEVPALAGYKGEKIIFRILTIFLLNSFLKAFNDIFPEKDFKNAKLVHKAEGLVSFLEFFPKPGGIFLDIGEKTTRIFSVRKSRLAKIDEFEMGGRNFSKALLEKLGLTNERIEILKEKYSCKMLSPGTSEKIKEILLPEVQDWFSNLEKKLSEQKLLTSKNVWLFGAGCRLPEIKEILEEKGFNSQYAEIPESIKLPKEMLNNSENFSSILICYGV